MDQLSFITPSSDAALEGSPIVTLQWQGETISTLQGCGEGLGSWAGFLWDWKHFQSEDSHLPRHSLL